MFVYVLKDKKSSGEVYFKEYNPYTKEDCWTGVLNRACFWLDYQCAYDQASSLGMKGMDYWEVVVVEV